MAGRRLDVHEPTFGRGTLSLVSGQVLDSGCIHGQDIESILIRETAQAADTVSGSRDKLKSQSRQSKRCAIAREREIIRGERGQIDLLRKDDVQRIHGTIARIGSNISNASDGWWYTPAVVPRARGFRQVPPRDERVLGFIAQGGGQIGVGKTSARN